MKLISKRFFILFILLWIGASIGGFFFYQAKTEQFRQAVIQDITENLTDQYYKTGFTITKRYTDKKGMGSQQWIKLVRALVEKDQSMLADLINEAESELEQDRFRSIGILDAEDRILAHSEPDKIGKRFEGGEQDHVIGIYDEVRCSVRFSDEKRVIVGYRSEIKIQSKKIGSFYLNILSMRPNLLRGYFLLLIAWIFLLSPVALYLSFLIISKGFSLSTVLKEKVKRRSKKDGNQFGPYILKDKIAQGGMAELYIADQIREDGFRRTVAVKKVLPHLSQNPEYVEMLGREARIAGVLQHPNIIQIYDYRKYNDSYFIVMEYVRGRNLAEIMAKLINLDRAFRVDEATYIISQVAKGLHYSHTRRDEITGEQLNIVHRDISPQNILLSYEGEVKISDFGISKASTDPQMTQAGVIKGKLGYLSPEQASGESVDHRSDIYSLGIIFYEILTGKRLYKFSSDYEAISIIPKKEIEPIKKVLYYVNDELNRIVMKCLEKDREKRYQTANSLFEDLAELKSSSTMSFDMESLSRFMDKFF